MRAIAFAIMFFAVEYAMTEQMKSGRQITPYDLGPFVALISLFGFGLCVLAGW